MALAGEIVAELKAHANPANVAGMVRFGISTTNTLGVSLPVLRGIAKRHRRDHDLAMELWATGIHEARILASLVADPKRTTAALMDAWVKDFESWDVCDQACQNLFWRADAALRRAPVWARRKPEFVRRAGFVTITQFANKRRDVDDAMLLDYLALAREAANDDRNYVKKAVSWALRRIGRRNDAMYAATIAVAKEMAGASKSWAGRDALRELLSGSGFRSSIAG